MGDCNDDDSLDELFDEFFEENPYVIIAREDDSLEEINGDLARKIISLVNDLHSDHAISTTKELMTLIPRRNIPNWALMEMFIDTLEDDNNDTSIKAEAAYELGNIVDEENHVMVLGLVRLLAKEENDEVKLSAIYALRNAIRYCAHLDMRSEVLPILLSALQHDNSEIRISAMSVIDTIIGDWPLNKEMFDYLAPKLLGLSKNSDRAIRKMAKAALATIAMYITTEAE